MVSEVKDKKAHTRKNKKQKIKADSHKVVPRNTKQKLTAEQSMTQAIMQTVIEATKATIMVIREADNLINNARLNTCNAQIR